MANLKSRINAFAKTYRNAGRTALGLCFALAEDIATTTDKNGDLVRNSSHIMTVAELFQASTADASRYVKIMNKLVDGVTITISDEGVKVKLAKEVKLSEDFEALRSVWIDTDEKGVVSWSNNNFLKALGLADVGTKEFNADTYAAGVVAKLIKELEDDAQVLTYVAKIENLAKAKLVKA